jgi:REP element-mobilizing transposase RayT
LPKSWSRIIADHISGRMRIFISSVSDLSEDVIKEYIQEQGKKSAADPA